MIKCWQRFNEIKQSIYLNQLASSLKWFITIQIGIKGLNISIEIKSFWLDLKQLKTQIGINQ